MLLCFYFIYLSGFLISANCVSDEEVQKFSNWLQDAQEKAMNGELRTDNSDFRPQNEDKIEDFGEYDFIVVGGGASGTIVTNRLSENSKWKILLLEAGGLPDNFTGVPFNIDLSRFTQWNWGYKTVPQKHSCLGMVNHECLVPRGKGVGGTTLVNGLMYVRGHPTDFDEWGLEGNQGWSFSELLPIFKKTEGMHKNNPQAVVDWQYHNRSGLLHTEFFPSTNIQIESLYKSLQNNGYQFVDVNSPKQIGFSPKTVNIKNGWRFDDGTAFIVPFLKRKNLRVQTHSLATKINFDGIKAKSVTFSHNGKLYKAKTKKEIIVSAGAINTPQLLMLSGIGPDEELSKHKIPKVQNLDVGKVLREHPAYYGLVFSSNYTEPIKPFDDYVRELFKGYGPLTLPAAAKVFGFIKSKYEKIPHKPDLEFMFVSGNCSAPGNKKLYNWTDDTWEAVFQDLNPAQCFSIIPFLLRVKSKGSVKLKSGSPYDFPLIDLNHLAEEIDRKTMYEGIKMILKWTENEAFKKVDAKLAQKPLPACKQHEFLSEEYWYCSMAQLTYNIYHPVGSCPMGKKNKGNVVDENFAVHGTKKLRVADASVFPFTLRGHPNAVCVMLGEKLAMVLKNKYS